MGEQQRLGETAFESHCLRTVSWQQQQQNPVGAENAINDLFIHHRCALSPNGEQIALIPRNATRAAATGAHTSTDQRQLLVFTSGGKRVCARLWSDSWELVPGGFGWTAEGTVLVAVLRDGTVLLFDHDTLCEGAPRMLNCPFPDFVSLACIWSGGICLVSASMSACAVTRLAQGRSPAVSDITRLPLDPSQPPHTITVLQPAIVCHDSRNVQFAIGLGNRAGLLIYSPRLVRHRRVEARVPMFALAQSLMLQAHPSEAVVASYGTDGRLTVLSADLTRKIIELDCPAHLGLVGDDGSKYSASDNINISDTTRAQVPPPSSIEWIGRSFAVAAMWNGPPWAASGCGLLLVGPANANISLRDALKRTYRPTNTNSISNSVNNTYQSSVTTVESAEPMRFAFSTPGVAVHEVDGLRIVSADKVHLVRQVPRCMKSIYGLGSCTPAAILVEAVESLRNRNPDAEASISALVDSGDIAHAVEECIEASLCALNDKQRADVLYAAAYAKCFVGVRVGDDGDDSSIRIGTDSGSSTRNSKSNSNSGRKRRSLFQMQGVRHRAALSERFVLACRVLKSRALLDASDVMCVTGAELWTRTPLAVVASVLQAAHFGVAAKICDLFGISHKVVAVQWVRKTILLAPDTVTDAELLRTIQDRLRAMMMTMSIKSSQSQQSSQSNAQSDVRVQPSLSPIENEVQFEGKYDKNRRRRSAQAAAAVAAVAVTAAVPNSSAARTRATTAWAAATKASTTTTRTASPNTSQSPSPSVAPSSVDLQMLSRLPFAAWAACAASIGRKRLAFELCLLEPRLSLQVVQLLSMKDWERAFRLADEAPGCDPQLQMYAALYCLALAKAGRISHDVLTLLFVKFGCVKRCLTSVLREQDPKLLGDLLLADGSKGAFDHAMLLCADASQGDGGNNAGGGFESAQPPILRRAYTILSKAGSKFHASAVQDQSRLLELQHAVSDSLQGQSLGDTVLDCFRRGNEELAEKFRLEFKMRPALFFTVKLKGVAARHAWTELRTMSTSKEASKVLIPTDFAGACFKEGNHEEALHYLQMSNAAATEDKTSLLMKLGRWEEAAECAYLSGDPMSLFYIRTHCASRPQLQSLLPAIDVHVEAQKRDPHPPANNSNDTGGKAGLRRTREALFGATPRAFNELRGAFQDKAVPGCSQQ